MPEKKKKDVDDLYGNLFVKKVPRRIMRAFHAWCSLRGITVRSKVISLLKETAKNTEVE